MKNCKHCLVAIDEEPHYTYYNESGVVTKVVCEPCVHNEMIYNYNQTKHISTKLMMEASMAKYRFEDGKRKPNPFILKNKKSLLEVANAVEEVKTLIHEFEDKHWVPYLRKYWNKSNDRGHIAEISDLKVMMWGCAGRVLITVENDNGSVTMIFSDYVQDKESMEQYGRTRGGIQGIETTSDNAVTMLKTLIEMKKIVFKIDKNVKMGGF